MALRTATLIICGVVVAAECRATTPADPGPADVRFTIDGSHDLRPISPYIYGSNSASIISRTADRSGGNRMTGHNWETNASNAGADYYHHSDLFLTSGQANLPPGAVVHEMLQQAAAVGRAALVTVPMAGYVAADTDGTVDETGIAPSGRWREVVPKKSTIYPDLPLSIAPNTTDDYVFTDEFAYWVEAARQVDQAVFYSLDNEPALWGETLPAGWQSGNARLQRIDARTAGSYYSRSRRRWRYRRPRFFIDPAHQPRFDPAVGITIRE